MGIPSKDHQILQHIVRYCNQVESTISFFGATKEDFQNSFLIQNAILMPVQQIGELTKRFTDDFRKTHPDIPWRAIAGMRDYLTHEYLDMDVDIAWNTASKDIPVLRKYCIDILNHADVPLPEIEKTNIRNGEK